LAYDRLALTPQKPAVRIPAAIALFKIFGIAVCIIDQLESNCLASAGSMGRFPDWRFFPISSLKFP